MEDVIIAHTGIVFLTACVKKGMDINEVTDKVNEINPTGISSSWSKSDENFHDGNTNPCQCDRFPDREHILFNC